MILITLDNIKRKNINFANYIITVHIQPKNVLNTTKISTKKQKDEQNNIIEDQNLSMCETKIDSKRWP